MGVTLKDWYDKDQVFDHDTFFVRDENGEIVQFSKGKKSVLEPLEVTENGNYLPPEGVDGFSGVDVNVPTPEVKLQDKTITENGTFTADSGYDGLGSVTVEIPAPSGGTLVAKKITFTANSTSATVTHGLGTIPLCAVVFPTIGIATANLTSNYTMLFGFALSEAVKNAMGTLSDFQYGLYWNTNNKTNAQTAPDYTLESDRTNSCLISNANETSITFGGGYYLKSGTEYTAYVIGMK